MISFIAWAHQILLRC